MKSKIQLVVVVASLVFLAGCATVQESRAKTRTTYQKVWNACIESVSDIRFSVSSTDPATGLIIADSAVVSGHGTVSRLNIQLLKEMSDTTVAVKFVPPWGTIGGWGTADKYIEAVKKRVPDLRVANQAAEQSPPAEKPQPPGRQVESTALAVPPARGAEPGVSQKQLATAASQTVKSPPSSTATALQMVVEAKKGKLRQRPSTSGKVVKTLKKGDTVEVVKRDGEWCLVTLSGGEVGWCHVSLLGPSR